MANFHDVRWTPDSVARLWEYYAKAPVYQDQYFSSHSGKYILDFLQKNISLNNQKVLDFGCGPGYFLDFLVPAVGQPEQCFGLEFSPESVQKAQQRLKKYPNFGKVVCVKDLPSEFKDESFDVIVAIEVVEHLEDAILDGMLKEVYRLLKKGGQVLITTPNQENRDANTLACPECGCMFHRWQHVRTWDPSSLRNKMESAGFSTVLVEETFFQPTYKNYILKLKKRLGRKILFPHLAYIGKKN